METHQPLSQSQDAALISTVFIEQEIGQPDEVLHIELPNESEYYEILAPALKNYLKMVLERVFLFDITSRIGEEGLISDIFENSLCRIPTSLICHEDVSQRTMAKFRFQRTCDFLESEICAESYIVTVKHHSLRELVRRIIEDESNQLSYGILLMMHFI